MTVLAFYCGAGRWQDAVIRQVTCSRFSHVELFREGHCISASKRDGNKVRLKRIGFKTGHWAFVQTPHDARQTWDVARGYIGQPYDTAGAVLSGLGVPRHVSGAWFCSELLAHALGLPEPHTYTPGALWAALT